MGHFTGYASLDTRPRVWAVRGTGTAGGILETNKSLKVLTDKYGTEGYTYSKVAIDAPDMQYQCVMEKDGIAVGDHVAKKKNPNNPRSIKYVGRVLAIYKEPHLEDWWCVVLLDENDASDRLQHLYPFDMFEKIA